MIVNADVTARLDLKLEVGAVEEDVTVTGQSPLLDTTSALKQTVLTREVLDAMPNRIDVWSVARVVPSVILSKVDVGGSEAFLQSTPTVHGSSLENGYFIDGMDVSALDGNGTVAAMYLDPETWWRRWALRGARRGATSARPTSPFRHRAISRCRWSKSTAVNR